jgi:hypothetical protein
LWPPTIWPSGCSPCGGRQLLALARHALDDPLDDLLGDLRRGAIGCCVQRLDRIFVVVVLIGDQRVERLRQLRAIAIERVGLQRQLPGEL